MEALRSHPVPLLAVGPRAWSSDTSLICFPSVKWNNGKSSLNWLSSRPRNGDINPLYIPELEDTAESRLSWNRKLNKSYVHQCVECRRLGTVPCLPPANVSNSSTSASVHRALTASLLPGFREEEADAQSG